MREEFVKFVGGLFLVSAVDEANCTCTALACPPGVVRSYLGYYAGSHQNSAAKRPWARIVLPWVTRWEVLVSYPTLLFLPPTPFASSSLEGSCLSHHRTLHFPTTFGTGNAVVSKHVCQNRRSPDSVRATSRATCHTNLSHTRTESLLMQVCEYIRMGTPSLRV